METMNIPLVIVLLIAGVNATIFLLFWIYKIIVWHVEDLIFYFEHKNDKKK